MSQIKINNPIKVLKVVHFPKVLKNRLSQTLLSQTVSRKVKKNQGKNKNVQSLLTVKAVTQGHSQNQ